MRHVAKLLAVLLLVASRAAALTPAEMARMRGADIVLLGETHDNAAHHARQASLVAALRPKALVFEMLTPAQAERLREGLPEGREALADLLEWDGSGWPDFAMYEPIFRAARGAPVLGAEVPRGEARQAMREGIAEVFGPQAARYGLTEALPEGEQARLEAEQRKAHCNALPEDLLPGMVAVQRLRDAVLARAAIAAWRKTGGPVVVITGNGHARRDGGVPAAIARAAPDLRVFALGQSEDGQLEGVFDAVADSAAAERPDPCAALRGQSGGQ